MMKNIYKAPKSTILALLMILSFVLLKHYTVIDSEVFGTLTAIVIPLAFSDILREKKTPVE